MRMSVPRFSLPAAAFPLLVLLSVGACSLTNEGAGPSDDGEAGAIFNGDLDPSTSTFVFRRIDAAPPNREPVPIELVGSRLMVDPTDQTVTVAVAIRNASDRPLSPSALVFVNNIDPADITIINADAVDSTRTPRDPVPDPVLSYIFDYSDLLGDDQVLRPGETSGSKPWIFRDRGLRAFSFSVQATFGLGPTSARIAGSAFWDANGNGEFDRDEEPVRVGLVELVRPDGEMVLARVGERGRYEIPVRQVGLYRATFRIPLQNAPLCFTTPHPLEILLPPGPDGTPVSYEEADFGVFEEWPCPGRDRRRAVMTDLDPDRIEQAPYDLLGAELDGDVLSLAVGISGCTPDHPFTLYASRQFMESEPVRTWVILAHDDLGEPCRAYFTRRLAFDLGAIREAFVATHGAPGLVILELRDFQGEIREFRFGP
jgi:hypothetical protein